MQIICKRFVKRIAVSRIVFKDSEGNPMNSSQAPETGLRHFSLTLLRLRNRHFLIIDLLIFCITPGQALLLRTDQWSSLSDYAGNLVLYMLLALSIRLSVFYLMGLYQRFWRYAS